MNEKIQTLLSQIAALEEQLKQTIHEQESRIVFQIKGKRVEFDKDVRNEHAKLKRKFLHWLITDRPQNLLTGPIIYFMVIPMLLLDVTVTAYQAFSFPIYRIAKVQRKDYIIFDRHQLGYLNFYERLHCEYCAYANGLLAYASEVVARTEQYFCPIKHARKILGTHARYTQFLAYGQAQDYHQNLEKFRVALGKEMMGRPHVG
ncbi:MAG: hypothetical protein WCD07_02185 [Burkholderiales bacterium]